MAAAFEMKVDQVQFKQLADALKSFGDKPLRIATRAAVKDAMRPIEKAAQRTTPVGETGQLARSMGTKIKQYPRKGVTVGIVGARKGFKKQVTGSRGSTRNVDPVNYLHLVELGHNSATGFVKGNPFLQRALRRTSRRAVSIYSSELARRVVIQTKKAARKIKKSNV